jgi:mutator family transposase
VIQEAWIGSVSTRRVDELVQDMGLSGISKSQASKPCRDIDERVNAFLDRPIEGEWPDPWLDAPYLKVHICIAIQRSPRAPQPSSKGERNFPTDRPTGRRCVGSIDVKA